MEKQCWPEKAGFLLVTDFESKHFSGLCAYAIVRGDPVSALRLDKNTIALGEVNMTNLYVAWLTIVDEALNQKNRPAHLAYLGNLFREGRVAWGGPFGDRSGGMVVYRASSLEDAVTMAEADPAVSSGARTVVVKQWELLDLEKF